MDEKFLSKTVGANIRLYRIKMNLTQSALADFIQLTQTQISALERGASVPKLITVMKLAEVFGINVDDLLH